jgi:rfaE bifunctional protein kinase chain/domain
MKFIVLGDLILDRFIYGDITRISPEAPVPVLDVREVINSCGGAFNVHAHIESLGFNSTFISIVGNDIKKLGDEFFPAKAKDNVKLIVQENRKTSLKTRIIAIYNHNHQIRFDDEDSSDISTVSELKIMDLLIDLLDSDTYIILNDYNKGVITFSLAEKVIRLANSRGAKVFVDSKRDDVLRFSSVFLLKPNKHEFNMIKLRYDLSEDFTQSCKELVTLLKLDHLVVTLGDNGIFCCTSALECFSVPSIKTAIKELSGAGDSVLAAISAAVAVGNDIHSAIKIANNIAAKFISTGPTYRANIADFKC